VGDIALSVASDEEAPVYVSTPSPNRGLPRAGLRVYLGTIPDYTQSEKSLGLKLSGVAAGGPADRAGIRAGDVITMVSGKTIENIYDYTFAIDGLVVGVPVAIVVVRDGERLSFEITPASRE